MDGYVSGSSIDYLVFLNMCDQRRKENLKQDKLRLNFVVA